MNNVNEKIIYSSNIAGQLCRLGFKVIRTGFNSKKPWLTTFIFEYTDALQSALDDIFDDAQKQNK